MGSNTQVEQSQVTQIVGDGGKVVAAKAVSLRPSGPIHAIHKDGKTVCGRIIPIESAAYFPTTKGVTSEGGCTLCQRGLEEQARIQSAYASAGDHLEQLDTELGASAAATLAEAVETETQRLQQMAGSSTHKPFPRVPDDDEATGPDASKPAGKFPKLRVCTPEHPPRIMSVDEFRLSFPSMSEKSLQWLLDGEVLGADVDPKKWPHYSVTLYTQLDAIRDAAPDLLESAKRAIVSAQINSPGLIHTQGFKELQAAITKATGGAA